MGDYPMYPRDDNRRHPGSETEWHRQQDGTSWRTPSYPDSRDENPPYPGSEQPQRWHPEPWDESQRSASWSDGEPSSRRGWHSSRGMGSHAGRARPQETQAYSERASYRQHPPEARVSRSQSVREPLEPESFRGRPGHQERYRRPNGRVDSGAPQTSRFSPLWVSAAVVSMLLGLVLVQVADLRALHGADPVSSVYAFFIGLIFVFSPTATRIVMQRTGRAERLTLVILLGVAFYMIKVQASPNGFLLNDEFIHFRNTQNVLSTGHLFGFNPLLPTAAYYPGLATITATLADFTGLSIFVTGLIIIGAARIVISASFYLVAEKVIGSSRGAGMASLLYATNSMFLFWSAQFAYENLALPLAAFSVWWIARARNVQGRVTVQAIAVVVIAAVTVTHHISAFALCGVLAALYIAQSALRYPRSVRRYTGGFALLTGAMAAFWFFIVAKPAAGYLFGQNFVPAMQGIASAVSGHGGRQLYGGAGTGQSAPKWYVDVGFGAILIIMVALLPAAIRAWRILRARGFANLMQRRAPIAVATIIALTFPFTLLPRLTADGSAISGRTSEYIFTAIGCTLGLLMDDVARSTRLGTRSSKSLAPVGKIGTLITTLLLSVVFVGQVSIGNSFFNLLPDKSVGFPAYVQPSMIDVANWAGQHLGTGQTFATDNTNVLSLATYGQENPVNVNIIYPMFFTADMGPVAVNLIKTYQVHYVLLDWLATEEPPVGPGGSYYSALEPDASLNGKALPRTYYSKFSTYTCSRLVYRSGSIQIYDVSLIASGKCVPRLIHKAQIRASAGKSTSKSKAVS